MQTGDWIASPRSRKDIEALAVSWLDHFGFFHHYVANLPGILEHDMPELVPGFILKIVEDCMLPDAYASTKFDPLEITVRESVYNGMIKGEPRSRFTIAHEIGHALMHSTDRTLQRASVPVAARKLNRSYSAEWQADCFASSFLMPEHIARTFDNPQELSQNCQVSLAAAQIRLSELGIWPKKKPIPDLDFLKKYKN